MCPLCVLPLYSLVNLPLFKTLSISIFKIPFQCPHWIFVQSEQFVNFGFILHVKFETVRKWKLINNSFSFSSCDLLQPFRSSDKKFGPFRCLNISSQINLVKLFWKRETCYWPIIRNNWALIFIIIFCYYYYYYYVVSRRQMLCQCIHILRVRVITNYQRCPRYSFFPISGIKYFP